MFPQLLVMVTDEALTKAETEPKAINARRESMLNRLRKEMVDLNGGAEVCAPGREGWSGEEKGVPKTAGPFMLACSNENLQHRSSPFQTSSVTLVATLFAEDVPSSTCIRRRRRHSRGSAPYERGNDHRRRSRTSWSPSERLGASAFSVPLWRSSVVCPRTPALDER